MKKWSTEIEIQAPIEKVWGLLNGSEENIQKIMPQVVEHKPVKITDEGVGSIYRQKYKEGSRVEEYEVETLKYSDTPDHKELKVGFSLANLFDITAHYEMAKLDENRTLFKYTASTQPLKWFVKLFLIFANDKVVKNFAERVKHVAEAEA